MNANTLDRMVRESRVLIWLSGIVRYLWREARQSRLTQAASFLRRLMGWSYLLGYLGAAPLRAENLISNSFIVSRLFGKVRAGEANNLELTKLALMFLVIFVPFDLWLITKLPASIKYLSDAAVLIAFLTVFVQSFRRGFTLRASALDVPVLLMIAAGLASALLNNVPLKVLIFGMRAYLEYYLVYLVLVSAPLSDEDRRKLVLTALYTAGAVALLGTVQKLTGLATPHTWVSANENIKTRVFATMQNPNTYAGYAMMAISMAIALVLKRLRPHQKAIIGIGLALLLFSFVFTYSREGILALGLAIVVLGFSVEPRLLVVLVVIAFLALGFDPKLAARIGFGFSHAYASASLQGGRLFYWSQAMHLIERHPLLGVGPGRFGGSVAHIFGTPVYAHYDLIGMPSIDSEIFQVTSELGLVGLLAYVWLLFAMVRQGIYLARHDQDGFWRAVGAGTAAAAAGFFIQSIFANIFEVHQLVLLLWLFAGLVFYRARQRRSIQSHSAGAR